MTSPFAAILAGLGAGASDIGTSMDQRAVLLSQQKRQAAMDAIARAQKLQEMGLTPTNNPDPTAPENLSPVQRLAMQAQSPEDVIAVGKQMTPQDYAFHQIMSLPNATGGTELYTQGPTPDERKEARDAARQADAEKRQLDVLKAQQDAKAIDPATMRKALDGDMDAVSQVLSKHPELQTTFNRPDKTVPAITPYQQAELDLRKRALDLAGQRLKGGGDKDAMQMQMAQTMAQPAIDQLKGYFAKQENPNLIARAGSHVPLVGNSIVGIADPDYQKAQQSAEVLATQYTETLPKGRANPALINQLKRQIAPELGDTPATRAQKLNTILTFEKAIAKRAGQTVAPTNPFADLIGGGKPEDE